MKSLEQEFGASVILLTYHVDYWDNLGWKDTFSDKIYTGLQKKYAEAFSQDSIYTPELVIQGDTGFNGSDLTQASNQVRAHLTSSRPGFPVSLEKKTNDSLAVSVQLPFALASRAHELLLVIYENAPSVHVLRGENQGVTMSGNFAVRHLMTMSGLKEGYSEAMVHIDPSWTLSAMGAVVLVKGDTSAILAAQSIKINR